MKHDETQAEQIGYIVNSNDLAEMCDVSPRTIQRLVKEGLLHSLSTNGHGYKFDLREAIPRYCTIMYERNLAEILGNDSMKQFEYYLSQKAGLLLRGLSESLKDVLDTVAADIADSNDQTRDAIREKLEAIPAYIQGDFQRDDYLTLAV